MNACGRSAIAKHCKISHRRHKGVWASSFSVESFFLQKETIKNSIEENRTTFYFYCTTFNIY
jgi:hypothetical protein